MSDTADKIAKILEDPESIKMISEIAESFMKEGVSDEGKDDDSDKNIPKNHETLSDGEGTDDSGDILPDGLKFTNKLFDDFIKSGDVDNSIQLISALKPYMSRKRRDNADSVIKWLKAISFIGKYNLSDFSKIMKLLG